MNERQLDGSGKSHLNRVLKDTSNSHWKSPPRNYAFRVSIRSGITLERAYLLRRIVVHGSGIHAELEIATEILRDEVVRVNMIAGHNIFFGKADHLVIFTI